MKYFYRLTALSLLFVSCKQQNLSSHRKDAIPIEIANLLSVVTFKLPQTIYHVNNVTLPPNDSNVSGIQSNTYWFSDGIDSGIVAFRFSFIPESPITDLVQMQNYSEQILGCSDSIAQTDIEISQLNFKALSCNSGCVLKHYSSMGSIEIRIHSKNAEMKKFIINSIKMEVKN